MSCYLQFTLSVEGIQVKYEKQKNRTTKTLVLIHLSFKGSGPTDKTHLAFSTECRKSNTYSNLKIRSLFTSSELKLTYEVITVNRIIR